MFAQENTLSSHVQNDFITTRCIALRFAAKQNSSRFGRVGKKQIPFDTSIYKVATVPECEWTLLANCNANPFIGGRPHSSIIAPALFGPDQKLRRGQFREVLRRESIGNIQLKGDSRTQGAKAGLISFEKRERCSHFRIGGITVQSQGVGRTDFALCLTA